MNCQSCGAENRADAAFCMECGARFSQGCASCGRGLLPGARFCDGCGARVGGAAEGAGAPTTQPAARAGAPAERGAVAGERRTVTALLIDAVGSTPAGERMEDEEYHRMVHRGTELMMEAVERFEGTVTQFRGDGIMALFGAPIAHEDSARRAVSAAIFMRDSLAAFAEEAKQAGRQAFAYRIGLNTGPVIVGNIGVSDVTMDYTAIGDTVNLAARMEQWARPGAIYITEHTQRAAGAYFELKDLGMLEVKGKAEPVRVYEVERELQARSRLEASTERGLTPYVGRDEQLQLVAECSARARAGQGQVVFLVGEAGMGKSRLLLEFHHSVGDAVTWLEGRCLSWAQTFPYLPLIDIVRRSFMLAEGDDDRAVAARIDEGIRVWEYAPDLAAAALKYLLNVDPGEPAFSALEPQDRRERVLDALRALLGEESRRAPLVLAIEDVHWVDEQSRATLAALVDVVASLPMLLIVTSRPGHEHGLGDRSYYNRIVLQNLPPEWGASMVEAVLQAPGVPAELMEMIVDRADGNPFFIEEVSRALIETGMLRRAGDGYALARPLSQVAIPSTVQEVILSRIDRLDRAAKDAVQRAAVIGREFSVHLLSHVSGDAAGIERVLDELKSMELVYQKSYFPERSYMFKHALTQDVALATLLGDRRKALHRDVAAAIENVYGERIVEHYESLAHHYYQGEDWANACVYSKRVAERAQSLYATRAAIEHLTRALEAAQRCSAAGVSTQDATVPGLWLMRGSAYEQLGEFDKARQDFEAALAAADSLNDRMSQWEAYARLGMLWAGVNYEKTGEHFERAYELARRMEDPYLLARSLNRLGNWKANRDRPREGLQHHEEALDIMRDLDDRAGLAESLDFMGLASLMSGQVHRSRDSWAEAISIYREIEDRQALAGLLSYMALHGPYGEMTTYRPIQGVAESRALLDESLAIARQIGFRSGECYALGVLATLEMAAGRYDDAVKAGSRSLEIALEIGHRQWETSARYSLGSTYAAVHAFSQAIPHLKIAYATAKEIGSSYWRRYGAAALSSCLRESGDLAGAAEVISLEVDASMGFGSLSHRQAWCEYAEIQLERGELGEALRLFDSLIAGE